ncbi:MAG: 16S rRNA processing protein RimM [Firmicutes bacterium]|nr:16S rRNA processing protein RimM [Bacillota bacterium]
MLRSMKTNKWIVIGEIVGTQGNRGEIKVQVHTEFPERFSEMDSVRLFHQEQFFQVFKVENSRNQKGFSILKLAGVDRIDEAEKLRGMLIKVGLDEVMPLPPGRHYIFELIGLECITTSGQNLGVISDVLQTGANDVYVVDPHPGVTALKEILIPVIDEVVLEISPAQGRVVVKLLDGLLD